MSFGASGSSQSSEVFPAQREALKPIFESATGAGIAGIDPITDTARRLSARFSPGLAASADAAAGIAGGGNPFVAELQRRATNAGDRVGGVIDSVRGDLREQFTEDILPEIGGAAELAGARGGARQGVAEGIAARGLTRELSDVSSTLRFQDDLSRGAAATAGAQAQIGGITAAGAAAQQATNLGLAPHSAPFLPLQQASNIIGSPAVLSEGSSRGFSLGL